MFRVTEREGGTGWSVVEETGELVDVIEGYLRHIASQAFSPHTVRAHAYDLLSFWRWLDRERLDVWSVSASDLLRYIQWEKERANRQRPGANVYRIDDGRARAHDQPATGGDPRALRASDAYRTGPSGTKSCPARTGGRGWRKPTHPRGLLGHLAQRRGAAPLRLRVLHRLPRGLTPDEVQRLVGSFRTYRDKAIALLMLYGGLRSCEVLRLKLGDVDLAAKTVKYWARVPASGSCRWMQTPYGWCIVICSTSGRIPSNPKSSWWAKVPAKAAL